MMLSWVCTQCGDGSLPQEVFEAVQKAQTSEEVRKILAFHEVVVKVCDHCKNPETFFQG
jgi:hypothetical protein